MEACSGAHYWARALRSLGHDARIIAPRFVIPYRKSGKNDGNDAEAICEAASRPAMRFVPIKSSEQQAVLCLHRIRSAVVAERTAQINQIRGLLAEFGLIMPPAAAIRRSITSPTCWKMRRMACPVWRGGICGTKPVGPRRLIALASSNQYETCHPFHVSP